MHPEILRKVTSQRGRETREQAHRAVMARVARRMLPAMRRGIGSQDEADGFVAPAIPDYVDGSFHPTVRGRSGNVGPAWHADSRDERASSQSHPGGVGEADSRSTSMVPVLGSLSFWRIVDVPFETCVAALDSWLRTRHGDELRFGGSQLLGPMEHDRDLGTRRIQVRLARGPLYPLLRMRLDIDRWSSSSTALELIPCRLVRPAADYFRAGRLLLDSLTCSLPQPPEPWASRQARLNIDSAAGPSPDVSNQPSNNRPRQRHTFVDVCGL